MAKVQGIRRGLRSGACVQHGGDTLLATDVAQRARSEVNIAIGQANVAQSTGAQSNGIALSSPALSAKTWLHAQRLLLQHQRIGTRIQLNATAAGTGSSRAQMRAIAIEEVGPEERSGLLVDVVVDDLNDRVLLQLASIGHVRLAGREERLLAIGHTQWLCRRRGGGSAGHVDRLLETHGLRRHAVVADGGDGRRGVGWWQEGAHQRTGRRRCGTGGQVTIQDAGSGRRGQWTRAWQWHSGGGQWRQCWHRRQWLHRGQWRKVMTRVDRARQAGSGERRRACGARGAIVVIARRFGKDQQRMQCEQQQ